MLPKVQVRPKGPPFGVFFGTMRLFFENFRILSKGTRLHFFVVFGLKKTLNEPEWPLFEFFGIVRLEKYFFEKKFKKNFFEKFFPKISNSCSLNIFEPKIWRRLGTFPTCFFFCRQTTRAHPVCATLCAVCPLLPKVLDLERIQSL